ncbi:MAG: patatin-like phospholipase family protein [Candidatus Gottesmanbacteria bacterium]|nr:patatin-like phospholipase family protein [Candidatus Gottesmanbacteria bacterium]
MASSQKFALSMSGGGLSAIAYAGINEVLLEHNLTPSCYAGLSGGAALAILLASGLSTEEIIAFIDRIKTVRILNTHWAHLEVVDHVKLTRFIRDLLPYKTFESLPIPAVVFASDVVKKQPVAIQTGDIASAIVASCSMFPMLQPVKRRGLELVDGGFTLYYGAQYLRSESVNKVIGVDVTGLTEGSFGGVFRALFLQINAATTSNSRYELNEFPVDLDIKIRFPTPSLFSFDRKATYLVHLGRRAALLRLKEITRVVGE